MRGGTRLITPKRKSVHKWEVHQTRGKRDMGGEGGSSWGGGGRQKPKQAKGSAIWIGTEGVENDEAKHQRKIEKQERVAGLDLVRRPLRIRQEQQKIKTAGEELSSQERGISPNRSGKKKKKQILQR